MTGKRAPKIRTVDVIVPVVDTVTCPACSRVIPVAKRAYLLLYVPSQDAYDAICRDCASTVLLEAAAQIMAKMDTQGP